MSRRRFRCLVCGQPGLSEEPDGFSYDICSYCGWEDDTDDADTPSGANAERTMRQWRHEAVSPRQTIAWLAETYAERFGFDPPRRESAPVEPAQALDTLTAELDRHGAVLAGPELVELEQLATDSGASWDALLRLRSRARWT